MKLLSTTQMRIQKLDLESSVSVPGPCPGSRYYSVPDGTPLARTLEEIRAAYDAKQHAQRQQDDQRFAARLVSQEAEQAKWDRYEANLLVKREAEAEACAAERSRLRKSQAVEQQDLTRRRAEGSYLGPVTLKEAYSQGCLDEEPEHYAGERISLKNHSLVRNTKTAVSRTEWGRRGYQVKVGEPPHAVVVKQYGNRYGVFRDDQVEPKPARPPGAYPTRKECIALLS